jgi:integrase
MADASQTVAMETFPALKPKTRPRGMGGLYRRGTTWWIHYSAGGRLVRESSRSPKRSDAEALLKSRLQSIGRGMLNPAAEMRVTMAELFSALETDYQVNRRRSARTLGYRLIPLRDAFGDCRAIDVTTARVARYVAVRLADNVAAATINRELAALRRAFRLAVEQERVTRAPRIVMLREDNARQGFLEPADFERVVTELPAWLRDPARFAYLTGWRRGEIVSLSWSDINRAAGTVTLRRERSKNGDARVLPLTAALAELIERRWRARQELAVQDGILPPLVFFHGSGRPLTDFRASWKRACKAAGVPGILFHDLRRSAVRNLDRAGVSESVAMAITGHKTTSVYRRYRILDESDLRDALERTAAACQGFPAKPSVVALLHTGDTSR